MKISEIKNNVFKPPKKSFYFGEIVYGIHHFTPWNFNQSILTIRKERPKYLRCNYFKLFNYEISYGWPIYIYWNELGWKDKFNSPRFEWCPAFYIFFFKWQFVIRWISPDGDNDKYYEMLLHYLKYSDKDIEKAEKTWGWVNSNDQSTWDKNYLK
jgi:hypothetical protein